MGNLKKTKTKKIAVRIGLAAAGVLLALLLIVGGYLLYVVLSYRRLPDQQQLEILHSAQTKEETRLATGVLYSAVTYNIGFGAYSDDYSFFMDGGKYSCAFSETAVMENISLGADYITPFSPDFILLQELDIDATRSYHIDELAYFNDVFSDYDSAFAYNYFNSPYLFWPLYEPHGKINAGIATYSRYRMESAVRRSLPIMENFNRFFDLDRCYSVVRIPTENGKQLCIYNVHLSAYGGDDSLRAAQVGMLVDDMAAEYAAGNYVLCGGDFNHNLKLAEGEAAAESWAQPFPRSLLPDGFSMAVDLLPEGRLSLLQNTARDAGEPYTPYKTETYMLDGFILSDNVEMLDCNTVNTGFACSDHNPMVLFFLLKETP